MFAPLTDKLCQFRFPLLLDVLCPTPTTNKKLPVLNRTLSLHSASVFVLHHDWIRTAGERFVLDPDIPEARDWITSIVAEVVAHYPVDGVQFDDYFYAEIPASGLNDSLTFKKYGQGFDSKADW